MGQKREEKTRTTNGEMIPDDVYASLVKESSNQMGWLFEPISTGEKNSLREIYLGVLFVEILIEKFSVNFAKMKSDWSRMSHPEF